MFSCLHVTRLLSDRLERSLSWLERTCLHVHLLGCPPCRRFHRALHWLKRVVPAASAGMALPPEARERIRRALDQAAHEE